MFASDPASRSSPVNDPIEVTVICSWEAIDVLAGRIERAYSRRNPTWVRVGLTPGVWASAASRLLEVSIRSPEIPIDPELFVAVLTGGRITPDPWAELTQRRSQTRYLKALRQIVGQLRRELRRELRRAERQLIVGLTLDEVLESGQGRISPLTCYIMAYQGRRFDLMIDLQGAVASQHRSCPLYRQAARPLLPRHAYPCGELEAESSSDGQESMQFSLN
jgi:hypothetical protein